MFRVSFTHQLLVVALSLSVAMPLSLSAQTATGHATVQQVVAREVGGVIEVEIQTSGGPSSPDTQAITGPDRIVVDFPGALPSASLRPLKVHQGALKGVRSGLFFSNPPITRIVLDLTGPQSYKISTTDHATIVRLAASGVNEQSETASTAISLQSARPGRLRDAALSGHSEATVAHISPAGVAPEVARKAGESSSPLPRYPGANRSTDRQLTAPLQAPEALESPGPLQPTVATEPTVSVTYENGMLRIQADKATLSQVLYEVHLRTQAEIAIPAGAEQEKVVADLGPAPARDVLAQLLNGSAYNFIFVGDELTLRRVILTPRAASF